MTKPTEDKQMLDDMTENPTQSNPNDKRGYQDSRVVLIVLCIIVFLALIMTVFGAGSWANYHSCITAGLWAISCLAVGMVVGFMFGIPKILQGNMTPTQSGKPVSSSVPDQSYRQQVNTNLTEISDWLTKIIVGVGLIQLKEIPKFILGKATVLATSIDGLHVNLPTNAQQTGVQLGVSPYLALAVAIIVGFTALGFLFGYLFTRLYLAPAFARADMDALSGSRQAVEQFKAGTKSFSVIKTKFNDSPIPKRHAIRQKATELGLASGSESDDKLINALRRKFDPTDPTVIQKFRTLAEFISHDN